jgi:hypothetical protein
MRHRTSYPDPIAFKANDLLQIGAEDAEYPGWIRVTLNDGNEGWAPADFVRVLDGPARGMATADYCARELDVDVGDELQILGTYGGWHHVVNVAGEEGWVPQACVRRNERPRQRARQGSVTSGAPMRGTFGWLSVTLLAGAFACWGGYLWIGAEVDADGILREPFALIPLGWMCLIAALISGVAWLFMRSRD